MRMTVITDEQIRELRSLTQTRDDLRVRYTHRQLVEIRELCDIALGRFALSTDKSVRSARVKCAAIFKRVVKARDAAEIENA